MVEIKAIESLTRTDIARLAQCAAHRQDHGANPFERGSLSYSQFRGDFERAIAD